MVYILKINKVINYKINYKVWKLFKLKLFYYNVLLDGNFSIMYMVILGEYKCGIYQCCLIVDVLFLFIGIFLFDRYLLILNVIVKYQFILSQL